MLRIPSGSIIIAICAGTEQPAKCKATPGCAIEPANEGGCTAAFMVKLQGKARDAWYTAYEAFDPKVRAWRVDVCGRLRDVGVGVCVWVGRQPSGFT